VDRGNRIIEKYFAYLRASEIVSSMFSLARKDGPMRGQMGDLGKGSTREGIVLD
jgi:hypothetical protein